MYPFNAQACSVNPGDLILADEIGVVVIPQENGADILAKARAQAEKEEKTRARIREGKTVEQILAEFGRM